MAGGPIALVTGAGSGIGRAVAAALARNGHVAVLAGRRAALLDALAAEIVAQGGEALAIPCDVTREEEVEALFAAIEKRLGRLDLLFNNAGISAPPRLIDEMDIALWRQVVDTNLTGAFLCAKHAFGLMRRQSPQGGRIINNGSISAHAPRPMSAAYTATKHAITGLTKAISLDGRPFDIACGQIDIGNAASDMARRLGTGTQQANGAIMAEPLMDVEVVAESVLYMARLPLQANAQFLTVMATKMPFIGRG